MKSTDHFPKSPATFFKKAAANFRYKNMLELLDKCPNEERLNDLIEKIKTQTENNN